MITTGPAATYQTPGHAPAPGQDDAGGLMVARLKQLTSVVAPSTLVTSLLFYFGYIGTRSRFDYFGVYLDMTDLSNQQLLLYGLEVIYVPAALGFLAVLAALTFHSGVRWLLDVRGSDTAILIIGPGAALVGILLIGRALLGIFNSGVYDREVPGTTPLALTLGSVAMAYGVWICARRARRVAADRAEHGGLIAWYDGATMAGLRRAGQICVGGLAIAGLFWSVHEFAWASGSARAYRDAVKLPKKPEVMLDTRERLTDISAVSAWVEESPLSPKEGAFRYRYTGLRLLLSSGGNLFLVPERWTTSGRTLVVPYDDSVRIQLIPKPGGSQG